MAALSYSLLKSTLISFGKLPTFWRSPENHTSMKPSEDVTSSPVSVQDKGLKGKHNQVRLVQRNGDGSRAEPLI